MIDQITKAILLAQQDRSQVAKIASLAKSMSALSSEEIDELLDRLLDFADELQASDVAAAEHQGSLPVDRLIQPIIDQLVQRESQVPPEAPEPWSNQRYTAITRIYQLTPATSDLRNHLLRWLATEGSPGSLDLWAEWICNDPPLHRLGIVLAFAPLMQPDFRPTWDFCDRLLTEATAHSQIAPAVYDLFNYWFRHQLVERHPAEGRIDALVHLLGQLAGQLGQIEEGNLPPNANAATVNQLVSDSVSLIVALCDTFAQLKHDPAAVKLHQALQLRHRRVQTEAAAALTRMGDELGQKSLIQLAEQPIARLRVLAYAEELGFRDQISLELQGEIAIAESHLAIWLSEPSQMGLAPSQIEFLENREMYWPGYEHPVQCYLFLYSYGTGPQAHSNIAICGPMTHAFVGDLQHLSQDDIYAAFAGWQTVHSEIFHISLSRAEATFPNEWRRLTGDLHAAGFDSAEPRMAASFFGQLILIADATRDGQPGTAIADGTKTNWYSAGNPTAPIDWQLAFAIWRGHQMLKSFNETESESTD